jgi:hypothetical protein
VQMLAETGHETGGPVATAVQPTQGPNPITTSATVPISRTSDSSSTTSNDRFTG